LAFIASLNATVSGQVVRRVVDGDTVVVAGVGTVRLIGIDTPETVDRRQLVQRFGKEAAAFLRALVLGKTIRLEYDVERQDKYRRTLAYAYLPDGRFVNAEMVRLGYAHAYTEFPFKYLQQFLAFEREAREVGRGLWARGSTGPSSTPRAAVNDVIVYVTRMGDTYHRDGCPHLAQSKIAIALDETVGHYTACKVCKPPILTK
jgi:micrococcal nuclease